MGWLFKAGYSRRDMIAERAKGWERTKDDGTVITLTCLAHCYRGGNFSGVLWSVWERTFVKDGHKVEQPQRWIICDLLRFLQSEWGYKDLDESMHPFYYSCPLKYLELVPIEQYGTCPPIPRSNYGEAACPEGCTPRVRNKTPA
jgi:hypothetical protein